MTFYLSHPVSASNTILVLRSLFLCLCVFCLSDSVLVSVFVYLCLSPISVSASLCLSLCLSLSLYVSLSPCTCLLRSLSIRYIRICIVSCDSCLRIYLAPFKELATHAGWLSA